MSRRRSRVCAKGQGARSGAPFPVTAAHAMSEVKGATQSCSKGPCTEPCCEDVTSVIDDDLGLHDHSASVVIIGGGPHALATLSALHDGSLGSTSEQKPGSVCVIDPGSHFMQSWNSRFDNLEIQHLRSPTLAHPAVFEPTALLDFAAREDRKSELIDAPVAGSWLPSTDLSPQGMLLKALPSNALFRDFCTELEAKLPHTWLSGSAISVCKDASTGKFRVHYKSKEGGPERKVVARAVILATGPVGKWSIPAPFEPHMTSPRILHTEELLVAGKGILRDEITARCPTESARVLVIGGGISAAQAALAAYHAGHQVVLRSRRPLKTRAFDIESAWLDVRTADRLRFEFLCLPMVQRSKAVREAAAGGSVPANYMKELQRLAQASSATGSSLRLEVNEEIECSKVCLDDEHVCVNGENFAMVILATGTITDPRATPASSALYRSVEERFMAATVNGLPRVDSRLRWVPDEDLFVLGANAVLELGPGGGNLMGAMRGARVISHELHEAMGKAGRARPIFANMYASLGDRQRFGEHEAEIDVLAQQLNLSPRAETLLRKARKDRKATMGLKGDRDALKPLSAHMRRVAYA